MAPTLRGRPVSFCCQKVALEKNATPLTLQQVGLGDAASALPALSPAGRSGA
jgi:hypothetical protein